MFGLSMNPLKEYGYIAAIVILLAGVVTVGVYIHNCRVAHEQLQNIHAQSLRELKDAKAKLAADATAHANLLKAQKVDADAKLKVAADQHLSDLDRLRQLDADRAKRANLARAASGSGSGATCGTGESETESRFRSLEQVAARLADANRSALIAIDTVTAERDSLNGKP